MWILKKGVQVINADSENDKDEMLQNGWSLLTDKQIAAAGMLGHEHLVSPLNTTVNADGSITFTPPAPPADSQ
ncbi:hypothetical protein Defa_15780 [Desulfovibrio sp. TH_2024_36128]|uniref:Uncharacterized protein n=1 Tax=Desulfovibrio falkowii TaxID=3136602 RepID=A0ABQ0E960_9BACT